MNLHRRRDRILARRARADGWRPQDAAENRLFDACCTVLDSARELEQAAGATRSAGATVPSVGCLSAALESLANASLMMRQAAVGEAAAVSGWGDERTGERLLEATLNLRLAAKACALEAERPTPAAG